MSTPKCHHFVIRDKIITFTGPVAQLVEYLPCMPEDQILITYIKKKPDVVAHTFTPHTREFET